jgi:methionyl-tRNA formyltransferase
MKIIFIGTVHFSKEILNKLINLKANIVGVITKKNSNFNSDFEDLTPLCIINNIPFAYFNDVNDDVALNWIKEKDPDIIFCFGWSSLLKENMLKLAPMGVIGFHPTLLPQNRGRHPLIWALALGLKKTGSTFFFMDNGIDSGDILSQKEIYIDDIDDAKSLYEKIIKTSSIQVEEFLPSLINKTFIKKSQNNFMTNYWRKRNFDDGKIDLRMTSRIIYNLVRALTHPYIGAHINYNGEHIKIWKVKEVEFKENNIEPGKIIDIFENHIIIKCYDNAIELIEHEFLILPKIGDYL